MDNVYDFLKSDDITLYGEIKLTDNVEEVAFKNTSGFNSTLWLEDIVEGFLKPLHENLITDVCVIGAGMAGLSIAYHLLQAGKNVIVLEAKEIGSGETGRTTAHLSNAFDDRYYKVAKIHGEKVARLVAESHTQAIQSIEKIIRDESISCDFKRVEGYLFSHVKNKKSELKKEAKAATKAGLNVHFIQSPEITGFSKQAVLTFPNQAQFHPIKYLYGLTRAILKKEGQIYIKSPVKEIKPGKIIKIETDHGCSISAKEVVIATNAPIFDTSFSFAKQASYRSYVVAGLIPQNSLQHALYWDTADPYHYVRVQPYTENDDLVIIGGEDHRTGKYFFKEEHPFDKLENWYKEHFFPVKKIIYTWSGQIQEPTDYLAYIGRMQTKENNMYIVTGDSGNGITHGALAGMLISDLILKRYSPWESVYDPNRSKFKNLPQLMKHNLVAMANYVRYLLPGYVTKTSVKPEEGKILCKGWVKTAFFKDRQGKVCQKSPRCTHMNAPLRWNPIEKTWDCPAHGSRFSPCGKVLQGPAAKELNKADTHLWN